MEYKELQQQLEALTSLGYNREQIIKIAETAPSIFKYTPNNIKLILSSIKLIKYKLFDRWKVRNKHINLSVIYTRKELLVMKLLKI